MSLTASLAKTYKPYASGSVRAAGSAAGIGPILLASALSGTSGSSNSTLGKIVIGANEKAGVGANRGYVAPSSIAAAPASVTPASSGFGKFLNSTAGQVLASGGGLIGGAIAGIGAGISSALAARAEAKQRQALTDSFKVGSTALHGADVPSGSQPAPQQKWSRPTYRYDGNTKTIVREVSGAS